MGSLHSLGVVAYEMVSGKLPFKSETIQELYEKIRSVTPVPVHESMPEIPQGFSQAISHAIAKDRADRQESASEFINDLISGLRVSSGNEIEQRVPDILAPAHQKSDVIDLAIEMSDKLTHIYRKDRESFVSEPSVVVVNSTKKVIAVGLKAKDILLEADKSNELYLPIRDDKVIDREAAQRMLKHFVGEACAGETYTKIRVIIATPLEITRVERDAFQNAAYGAMLSEAHEVFIASRVICAAIGAGLPVEQPCGNVIVHIGGSTVVIAVISSRRILYSSEVSAGGTVMDETITQYIKRSYNLLIGERTAEGIRIELGSALPLDEPLSMEVRGRNLIEGVPKTITITDDEVREALADSVAIIANAVRVALARTPPELSADLIERGIVLTGSGALLKNLDRRLSIETGLPITVARDPSKSVMLGACHLLSDSSPGIKEKLTKPRELWSIEVRAILSSMIRAITSLFSYDLAIACGNTNIQIYARGRGIIISEPSIVVIKKNTNVIEAIGRNAKEILGSMPGGTEAFHPISEDLVVDPEMAGQMLRYFIIKAHNGKTWVSPRVVMPINSLLGKVERTALIDSALSANASEVYLIPRTICAALGAGLLITEPDGNMVVDIGGGTTDIAVISLSGIVYSRAVRVAGKEMDEAITQYIKRKYNLLIGERTAELVKIELGSAAPLDEPLKMEVRGRNLIEGIPKTITITDEEIREALADSVSTIVNAVRVALERTPPELSADIVERGIVLTGGGALLKNLDRRLSIETGLPVSLAVDPLSSALLGTGKLLSDFNLLREITYVV
jgi:rod shape-determining protein MreB and related proteins